MEDSRIVALYWQRQEQALEETEKKYGPYCAQVARRILPDDRDVEECVSDTYRAAWDSIPPHRPQNLATYLAKLTRRTAMKIWRTVDAQKRGGGEMALSLEELGQCIPDNSRVDDELNAKELTQLLNQFLLGLSLEERRVFIRRYFHNCSIGEICQQYRMSKSKAETMLHRTRKKLRERLEKEGYIL